MIENVHGLSVEVDERMPPGWIATYDKPTGAFAASNGYIIVHGNLNKPKDIKREYMSRTPNDRGDK